MIFQAASSRTKMYDVEMLLICIYLLQGQVIDSPTLEHHFKGSMSYNPYASDSSPMHSTASASTTPGKLSSVNSSAMEFSSDNPLRRGSEAESAMKSNVVSMDIDYNTTDHGSPRKFLAIVLMYVSWVISSTKQFYHELRHADYSMLYIRSQILMERSLYTLIKRHKMIAGTLAMHIFLAVNFGYILGPSGDESAAVTSLFGIGTMLLILTNVQLVFFMFKNNEVYPEYKT